MRGFFFPVLAGAALLAVAACCKQTPDREDPLADSPGMKRALEAIEKNPDDGGAYYMRGYLAALEHDERQVRETFGKAIRLSPNDATLRRGYGWALFLVGDYPGALGQWQKRAEMTDYQAYDVYYTLAMAEWRTGRHAEAIAHYQKAVERDERFGSRDRLLDRIKSWHPGEQAAILEVYSRWRYFY